MPQNCMKTFVRVDWANLTRLFFKSAEINKLENTNFPALC